MSLFVILVFNKLMKIQWNLCNPTSKFCTILRHPTKLYDSKVFLLLVTTFPWSLGVSD